MGEEGGQVEVEVWDVAVRIFHWALTLLLVYQFVTGEVSEKETRQTGPTESYGVGTCLFLEGTDA